MTERQACSSISVDAHRDAVANTQITQKRCIFRMYFVPNDAAHLNIGKAVDPGRVSVHFSCVDKSEDAAPIMRNCAMIGFLPASLGECYRAIELDHVGFNFDDNGLALAEIAILVVSLAGLPVKFHGVSFPENGYTTICHNIPVNVMIFIDTRQVYAFLFFSNRFAQKTGHQ